MRKMYARNTSIGALKGGGTASASLASPSIHHSSVLV